MVRVCDRCRREGVETVEFKRKNYELCEKCSERIEKYLNEKEKQGFFSTIFK